MTRPDSDRGPDGKTKVGPQAHHAAGLKGVAVALKHAVGEAGPTKAVRVLTRINQADGFDCMSCAWPDPDPEHRHSAEFCENGAKAVADEATKDSIGPAFFARHSIPDLLTESDYWLGKQGRLTHPMYKPAGSDHYEPISWPDAVAKVASRLRSMSHPDEAAFYTSGRASNEAAFLYQLFARVLGTNNLPDCSNMCHEASGIALTDAIGIGKGSVSLADMYRAKLIVLVGQNPGTNHPRMLSALEIAKRKGAKILVINPLREAGSSNFRNPQTARGVVGSGTDLSDLHLAVRVGGDQALFQAFGHLLLSWGAIDKPFIDQFTEGFDEWAAHISQLDWDEVLAATGLPLDEVVRAAEMIAQSNATIWCWAMGLTQHRNSVDTIRELVNLALCRGDLGKPGAGLCPVRGHSNVQGDRTMGIYEKPDPDFLRRLGSRFGFTPPGDAGFDVVESIEAMLAGKIRVFMALGGNFLQAAPDTNLTAQALESVDLTVQVSTKLNRSHLICGTEALILPTLGRTEIDEQAAGPQFVTVEDSMSVVHASKGRIRPRSDQMRSEPAIVADIAHATLSGNSDGPVIDWEGMRDDYRKIRAHIEEVIPGFENFEERVSRPSGFVLPHPPRDGRHFANPSAKAQFGVADLDLVVVPPGQLLLQTLRSHDQFNTTIYGLDDRYRGIRGGRRVVMLNGRDMEDRGLRPGAIVDLVSHWTDGAERRVEGFRVVEYDTPRQTAAAYYPETNPLVPLSSTGLRSNTPTSKSVLITVVASPSAPGRTNPPGAARRSRKKREREPSAAHPDAAAHLERTSTATSETENAER